MLPKYYRFRVYNSTKSVMTYNNGARISVSWVPWKVATGPTLEYGSAVTQNTVFLNSGEAVAAHAETEGTVIDNSSDLDYGVHGTFRVIFDTIVEEDYIYLYLETSTDNVTWPSDQLGFKITQLEELAKIKVETSTVDQSLATNFEI